MESEEKELCIVYNIKEGYYPKYNDNSNINNFIICYKKVPEGYFLDNVENIFKPIFFENNNSTGIEVIDNIPTEYEKKTYNTPTNFIGNNNSTGIQVIENIPTENEQKT